MACALETLEEILSYLHREFTHLNYAEKLNENDDLQKHEIKLDNTGCSLKCISHRTFGLETGDIL